MENFCCNPKGNVLYSIYNSLWGVVALMKNRLHPKEFMKFTIAFLSKPWYTMENNGFG